MAQFQTVQPPPLDPKLQLPKQPPATQLRWIAVHLGKEITLELSGPNVHELTIRPFEHPVGRTIRVTVTSITPTKQTFTVKALVAGKVPILAEDKSGKRITTVNVVAGEVRNHTINGFQLDVDLLAQACRGDDARVNDEIRKLLWNDPHNLFDQKAPHNAHPTAGDMTCGMVCKERSQQIFGKINVLKYDDPYHEPLSKVTKRTDVKYKPETIEMVKHRIINLLKAGSPVRVGVLDDPVGMNVTQGKGGGKLIAWHYGGHTIVIVGWSRASDTFMYVDTWPSGSLMAYNGGIAGDQNPDKCKYIGLLRREHDPARVLTSGDKRFNIIRGIPETEGTFDSVDGDFLEVVAGP